MDSSTSTIVSTISTDTSHVTETLLVCVFLLLQHLMTGSLLLGYPEVEFVMQLNLHSTQLLQIEMNFIKQESILLFLSLVKVSHSLVIRLHCLHLLHSTELTFVVSSSTLRREQNHSLRVYSLSKMMRQQDLVSPMHFLPTSLRFRQEEVLLIT